MVVLRATAKKVAMLHAPDKQEEHDREEHDEQKLRKSKPR
jgi:hypothetical protein